MVEGLAPGLSLALAGLELPGDLGARFAWVKEQGYRAVQLNAAEPGARPRELGRSARRDIAAKARRAEVEISGVDLWIPAEHFIEDARADRAMSAACEALEYAAEIVALASAGRRAVVSMTLPSGDEANRELVGAAARQIGECAQRVGAVVADFAWPPDARSTGEPIGVGIDPAAVIAEGVTSAAKAASRMGERLAAARLTDLSSAGMRVEPGLGGSGGGKRGRLDVMAYMVALATAGYDGFVVVDLRGVADAVHAAARCAGLGAIGGMGGLSG